MAMFTLAEETVDRSERTITIEMTSAEWETIRTATVAVRHIGAMDDILSEGFDWKTFETAMQKLRWACKQQYADWAGDPDNASDY